VRAAHRDAIHAEEWLIIEWPQNEVEPTRYWLSTLSAKSTFNPEFPLATPRIRLHCANILIVNDNQRDSAFALAHLF